MTLFLVAQSSQELTLCEGLMIVSDSHGVLLPIMKDNSCSNRTDTGSMKSVWVSSSSADHEQSMRSRLLFQPSYPMQKTLWGNKGSRLGFTVRQAYSRSSSSLVRERLPSTAGVGRSVPMELFLLLACLAANDWIDSSIIYQSTDWYQISVYGFISDIRYQSTVYNLLSTVYSLRSTVYNRRVYRLPSTIYRMNPHSLHGPWIAVSFEHNSCFQKAT